MLPKKRRPTPPGEILRYEFLEPLGITQKQLAEALEITRVQINEIIQGKRAITPDTAFRLSRFFDTTAEFWMRLQMDIDMWDILQSRKSEYKKIRPASAAV
ncbi:MAG: HigA family addiction module antitoxin [Nitrospinales bacterium]